jgi:hypothetical protein
MLSFTLYFERLDYEMRAMRMMGMSRHRGRSHFFRNFFLVLICIAIAIVEIMLIGGGK